MKSGLFVIALFLSAAFASAQDKKATTTTNPPQQVAVTDNTPYADMTFTEEEYNFGTVKQGEKVTHVFNFTNSGTEPLIINNAYGSCHCTVPEWPKEPVKKGDKGVIKVVFDSSGKSGLQDKTVTIQSNAKVGTKILHLKGSVEMPIQQPAQTNDKPAPASTPTEKTK